jgi:cell volume regulation protein A
VTAADRDLLAAGAVLLVGIVSSRIADRLRLPDVVLYLLAGVAVGPHGLDLFAVPRESVADQLILTFGASVILYEGGRNLDLGVLRRVWLTLALLATVGVGVTTLVAGLLTSWLAGLAVPVALLGAAVLAPTDPATVIPVMGQVGVEERLSHTAQAESALNDATGAIVALGLVAAAGGGAFSWGGAGVHLLLNALGGVGSGAVVGFGSSALVSGGRRGLRIFGRHEHGTIMSLVSLLASYLLAVALGVSGFMAVFAAGIVNGNKRAFCLEVPGEHEAHHRAYLSLTALLMRMMIFVLLGSQVDFRQLAANAVPAGLLVFALMFVARPATVLASLLPDRRAGWRWNEIAFLCWVRETGVIPAALAGILAADGVPAATFISSAVVIAILATLLLQATTTRLVARRLGVLTAAE